MEEKSVKETLFGISDSKVTPLTVNFPSSDRSKYGFNDLDLIKLIGITGSFGGAIEKQKNQRKKKQRGLYHKQ